MATTTDAVKILKQRLGDVPDLDERIATDKLNVRVAMLVYQVRTEAGLSQAELAKLVGTSQPNIARLEDADYEGHSLSKTLAKPLACVVILRGNKLHRERGEPDQEPEGEQKG